jgi:hypothetical protein
MLAAVVLIYFMLNSNLKKPLRNNLQLHGEK